MYCLAKPVSTVYCLGRSEDYSSCTCFEMRWETWEQIDTQNGLLLLTLSPAHEAVVLHKYKSGLASLMKTY